MNIQQLRIVRETVRQKFNLTQVGQALFSSQSGVSRALKELEDELGLELFERNGKRLVGLSAAGLAAHATIERILLDIQSLRTLAAEQNASCGKANLILATTHSQARYALPLHLQGFVRDFPNIRLTLHQASPHEIVCLLKEGKADLGIASEYLQQANELDSLPWYQWQHAIIAPSEHPLMQCQAISLDKLAQYPLVTYHAGFAGRSQLDTCFSKAKITPDIVLTALDADVIKTYVGLGLGVGIIAAIAFQAQRDTALAMRPAGELFGMKNTVIAWHRERKLHSSAYQLIRRLLPENSI